MPYIGKSPHFGVRNRFIYTATGDETSKSGADDNGATLTFTDGAYVDVYLNGVLLKPDTDYVTTTANTIGSLSALSTSDILEVIVFDVFSVSDTVSAASGGTFSGRVDFSGGVGGSGGNLVLKNTDTADGSNPTLTLQSGETDVVKDDVLGSIAFQAPDEAGGTDAILVAAEVQAVAQGTFANNLNDTALVFKTGYSGATTEKMRIASEGAVLIGETDDKYLEAYGGSNTNGLFIAASNGAFLGMGRDTSSNDDFIAGIHFHNLNNGDYDAQDADGQLVAWIRCKVITSDNNAGDDSGAYLQFVASNEGSAIVENGRIYSGFTHFYNNESASQGVAGAFHEMSHNNNDTDVTRLYSDHTSYTGSVCRVSSQRTGSSSYYLVMAKSADDLSTSDNEFYVRGDGVVASDGANNLASGADYAEFFETTDGKAIAVGTTVVLENNKVRASKSSDSQSSVIGVVRPKSTGGNQVAKVGVVGNTACMRWMNKYLIDDYGAYVMEETTMTKWTSKVVNSVGGNEEREFTYETDKIPADGTDIWGAKNPPSDAVVYDTELSGELKGKKILRRKLNPDFDDSKEYVKREDRDEWVIVGLMGQVAITKGQKMGDRWIKMRDVSDTVEEYMIR